MRSLQNFYTSVNSSYLILFQMKHLFKFLFSASLGAMYGLFFAQKSGKKLRDDLKKSKTPGKKLLNELKEVASESGKEASDWAENSEELQKLLNEARTYFDSLVEKSKDVSTAATGRVEDEFLELSEKAAEAAKRLKKSATQKTVKFKNELEKEVKTIAKKTIAKKAVAKKKVKKEK